ILEHTAQLKSMTDSPPHRIRRTRGGMDAAIEDDAVPLVVIAPAIVVPDVVKIDGRAEEKLTHVVERLRPGVGDGVVSPSRGPLHKGDVHSVIARIGSRRVLAIVGIARVWPASVVIARGRAGRTVLIDGDDQMKPAQMLIADAQGAVFSKLPLDLQA